MAIVKNDYKNEIVSGLPFVFGRTGVTLEPIEKLDRANGVIKWGEKNLYPQWLNSLFYGSAIHSGIIRSKVYYISSGGLNYEGPDLESWARMFANGTSDVNLDQLVEQMALDLELYNGVALRGRWSLDRSNCARLDLIPFETVRHLADREQIAVSPDWSDRHTGFMVYEPLNPTERDSLQFYIMYCQKPKQVVFDGKQKVETGAYPLAPYIGGIKSIQTDIEIVNYSHSEIINNFGLGTIINLNGGKPKTPEDRKKLEARIKGATGTDAAGGTVVLFNNGKDNAATIEKLNGNDLNDRYISLSEDVRKNILLAHSVTSTSLFGLSMDGNFNASEMEVGYEIMKANYFRSRQEALLSLIRNVATLCNNITGEITFNPVPLQQSPEIEAGETGNLVSEALGAMSPLVANTVLQVLTINEIRALASLGGIDGGDEPRGGAAPTAMTSQFQDSYNDYPESASNNAQRAIDYKEKNGSDCGTRVGWTRARQLANRENISWDTIARMASFKRHQQNKDVPYSEGCGGLMWDAWGGSSGIEWAISKMKQRETQEAKNLELDALLIDEFKKVGQPKEGLKILHKAEVDTEDVEKSQFEFIEAFKDSFVLTQERDINVIKLIADGESFDSILKALKLNPSDLSKIMQKLAKLGLLDSKGQITDAGLIEVATQDADRITVVYSYEKRPGVSGPEIIPGSRDFCRELIRLDRVYTRQEIDQIGVIAKQSKLVPFADVWTHSGGWWNRDGVNVSKCRHGWVQQVVFE